MYNYSMNMFKFLFISVFIIFLSSCSFMKNDFSGFVENGLSAKHQIDYSKWKHAESYEKKGGAEAFVFIPVDESLYDWTTKVEFVKYNGVDTVLSFYNRFIKPEYGARCYYSQNKSNIIYSDYDNLLFEYHVKNCGKKPNMIIIGNIEKDGNMFESVSYVTKNDELNDQEKTYIIDFVKSAKI